VPTVWREGPYRFYFFSHDADEPPHVHVDREDCSAKFWLETVALARNLGFGAAELLRIDRLVAVHASDSLEAWHDFFSS
jgi:hypothetical protein